MQSGLMGALQSTVGKIPEQQTTFQVILEKLEMVVKRADRCTNLADAFVGRVIGNPPEENKLSVRPVSSGLIGETFDKLEDLNQRLNQLELHLEKIATIG